MRCSAPSISRRLPFALPVPLAFALLTLSLGAAAADSSTAAGKGPNPRFYDVQKKLDPGGSFYLYVDMKYVFEEMAAGLKGILDQAAAQSGETDAAETAMVKNAIDTVFEYSSLKSLEDLGISVIPDGDLNRVRVFIRMPGEAKGLRTVLDGKPGSRRFLNVAPETTVLFLDSDLRIGALYNVIQSVVREAAPEDQKESVERALIMAEGATQMPWRKILQGLNGEMGIALSLDESTQIAVPGVDGEKTVQIPKPALLFALQTDDSTFFDSVRKLLTNAGMNPTTLTLSRGGEGFIIPVPPMPFPLEPTIAYQKPFFYFSTDSKVLVDGIERLGKGKGGLADNKEFVATLKDLPRENNGLGFVSRRLYGAMGAYFAESTPEAKPMVETLLGKKKGSVCVRVNDPDGIVLVSRTESAGGQIAAAGLVAPAGMLVAIAVPGFIRAREVSRRNACQENLIKIDGAKSTWALENNKASTDTPTWDDLANPDGSGYLRFKLVCPCGGTYTINSIDEFPTCSYQEGDFRHVYPTGE